jgi:hypothetical protein
VTVADSLHPIFAADDPAARSALVNELLIVTAVRQMYGRACFAMRKRVILHPR